MRKKFLLVICFLCASLHSALCLSAEPAGTEEVFLGSLTFFGESTTAHLRVRSELSPEQVWAHASGTARLDPSLPSLPVETEAGTLPLTEAAARLQPSVLVLSFGLNGAVWFSEHCNSYLQQYGSLITTLQKASPSTKILVQAVYPVAREQTDWKFSVTPRELNHRLQSLNEAMRGHCARLGAEWIDVSPCLTDTEGFLRKELTTDGIHLNEAAYRAILAEFCRYGCKKE